MSGTAITGRYRDTPRGQLHARVLEAAGSRRFPDLLCLHPAPYSGRYFDTVLPLLNDGRRVIAPDYPGYGNSYALSEAPSIADYANAIADAWLDECDEPVDLLGFHSGCLVAAELSLLQPDRVARLLLIDVPCFDADSRESMRAKIARPLDLGRDLECLATPWDFNVGSREDIVPLDRALALFVDQLSTGRRSHYCFHAAFTYASESRLAAIDTPTSIIATASPLKEPTLLAARLVPGATLVEAPEIETSVFEKNAGVIAGHIRATLDAD